MGLCQDTLTAAAIHEIGYAYLRPRRCHRSSVSVIPARCLREGYVDDAAGFVLVYVVRVRVSLVFSLWLVAELFCPARSRDNVLVTTCVALFSRRELSWPRLLPSEVAG